MASGSIILIQYKDLFLMGQETNYLTDDKEITEFYEKTHGKSIHDSFWLNSTEKEAHIYFSKLCLQLETLLHTQITYADFKASKSSPGFFSAKPRYVKDERSALYGFPKGSYESKDGDLKETIRRECFEETALVIDIDSIEDINKIVPKYKKHQYRVYHYKLTKSEYEDALKTISEKNKQKENELHNIQFMKIPKDISGFFINLVSKESYLALIEKKPGGSRKTRKQR